MENYKKHILILTPGFPKDESDENCIPPLQIFLKDFSKSFNEYKITVISIHYPIASSKYFWNKITVHSCGGNNISFPKRIKVWKNVMSLVRKIHQEFPISLIHSFWLGECAYLGSRMSKKYKILQINTLMGQELNERNLYLKFVNLNKTKIVALSDRQASLFKAKTGKNINKIIPWGIKPEERIINEVRENDIIGVGSLIPGKNFELFIEIVKNIKEILPEISVALLGDGTEKENVRNLIIKLNLENNIKLFGNINRKDVLNLMGKSKILLHTSKYESFGYVLAEALACGCYVVCSETGFAKNTNKMFVATRKDEYIKSISELLKTKPDYTPEIPFAINATSKMYKKLYDEICISNNKIFSFHHNKLS